MKDRRIFSALLALMLTTVSCNNSPDMSETGENMDKTNISSETEVEQDTELKDAVPEDLTFDGASFRILTNEGQGPASLVEGHTGEVYNDAKYDMELYTEGRLDVDISEVLIPWGDLAPAVMELAASNDATYDTISMTDRHSLTVAVQGAFHPMEEIPYVDLAQKYWGDGLSDQLSIGGRYYFAISSFNLYSIERATCVLFNEAVADKHNLEVPFDAVFEGTWTIDMFESYGNIATSDLNGDGVMNASDSYTFGTGDPRDIVQKFVCAAGYSWVDIDSNGLPYVSFDSSEGIVNVVEWTEKIFGGSDSIGFIRDQYKSDFADVNSVHELFTTDRELLNVTEFRRMNSFRDMESDFSILPMPKYDETQQRYNCYTSNVTFSMVPVSAADLEKAGAVQEVMSWWGYFNLLPAYIESCMQNKIARNQESAEVVNLIYNNRSYELGTFYVSSNLNNIYFDAITNGKSIIPTMVAQREAMEIALEECVSALTASK